MQKILVIEDDADLCALLQYNLENEGFAFAQLRTGARAIDVCRRLRPDLILLDVMLPDSNGFDICKGVRQDPDLASIPIIFLTARASHTDRIVGLEIGANDYVVKPFSVLELMARVRRQLPNHATSGVLRLDGVELDRTRCQVRLNGVLLALTATEFHLLEFLINHPGVVFSREQLLDAVWGRNRTIADRTVDVYMLRLRQKMERDPSSPVLIHSVRGFGYTFDPRRKVQRAPLARPHE